MNARFPQIDVSPCPPGHATIVCSDVFVGILDVVEDQPVEVALQRESAVHAEGEIGVGVVEAACVRGIRIEHAVGLAHGGDELHVERGLAGVVLAGLEAFARIGHVAGARRRRDRRGLAHRLGVGRPRPAPEPPQSARACRAAESESVPPWRRRVPAAALRRRPPAAPRGGFCAKTVVTARHRAALIMMRRT